MYLGKSNQKTRYVRVSKSGKEHEYFRTKTIVHFRCDNCNKEFTRDRGRMDPKRLSNNYFHVCENCDAKRFAQRRGIQAKQVWNLTASSSLPIGKL